MDSLDLGNLTNIYGNQGGLIIPQSYGEDSGGFDDIELLNNSHLSISGGARSRIFIGPNSDDDDRYKFFMVCAENKINALIERVREFNDNFGRPDEFENEAVSMAILQHGLKKNDPQNISPTYERSPNSCTIEALTTDINSPADLNRSREEDKRRSRRKRHYQGSKDQASVKEGFDVDDVYFLNEAVAAAIEQKGLCSSTLSVSE